MACCFTHYQSVSAPDIGGEIIDAHDMTDFQILGDGMPLVEINIPPQQAMVAEPGAFAFFQEGVKMESHFDDGAYVTEPGCCAKCKTSCARSCSGEAMTIAHFTNESNMKRTVGFGTDYPGSIIALDLKAQPDNIVFAMNGSFLLGAKGTRVSAVAADCKQCCCGAGWCFQMIDGNGMVFLNAGGSVVKQTLQGGTHRIDSDSLVAFTKGLTVDVQRTGGISTICCAGEGVALTTISGTGTYW
eukprot:CAMPEP_0117573190 /NCGR_PEP_ID=MMETSP0784-20121206/60810_1 /TAXON_ID=39447 /ORGANISM="" /LENGTH=242 /DNA_ID=CAMNT_0005371715 /DNA_START=14 /DNA_END=739 /DNA_ORIENTATION=-